MWVRCDKLESLMVHRENAMNQWEWEWIRIAVEATKVHVCMSASLLSDCLWLDYMLSVCLLRGMYGEEYTSDKKNYWKEIRIWGKQETWIWECEKAWSVIETRGRNMDVRKNGKYVSAAYLIILCALSPSLARWSGYYGHYGSSAWRSVGPSYYGGEIYFYVLSTAMYLKHSSIS